MSLTRTHKTLASAALWLMILVGGCAHGGGPSAAQVAFMFETDHPQCGLQRDSHLKLGGVSLSAVKWLVKLAGEEESAGLLDDLKRVEVATYRVQDGGRCPNLVPSERFEGVLRGQGWLLAVRERDSDEASWVFERETENGSIVGLLVVTLDIGEIEIVRVEGRIDEMLAKTIRERPSEAAEMVIVDG